MRRTTTMDGVEYAPGGKFRVIREGASLSGWKPMAASAWRGWARPLEVGDIIVCAGYGPGFGSDPGYGVEFESGEPGVGRCGFRPMQGGAFDYRPAPGYLEPYAEPESPQS